MLDNNPVIRYPLFITPYQAALIRLCLLESCESERVTAHDAALCVSLTSDLAKIANYCAKETDE